MPKYIDVTLFFIMLFPIYDTYGENVAFGLLVPIHHNKLT